MAITGGFVEATCERALCQTEPQYMPEEKVPLKGWGEVRYLDVNGIEQDYVLCQDCYQKYRAFRKAQDQQVARFMAGEEVGE